MTDVTGSSGTTGSTVAAGWYPDPEDAAKQRWWDGTRWSEHTHDPSLEKFGAVAPRVVSADTPTGNVFIWTFVLLPLLSLAFTATPAYQSMLTNMSKNMGSPTATIDMYSNPIYLLSQGLTFVLFAAGVLLAVFDWRKLKRDGFDRPFHWAWAFIAPVYIIGRSVVVFRRSRRGLAPLWVYIAIWVTSIVISSIEVSRLMSTMLNNLPGLSS